MEELSKLPNIGTVLEGYLKAAGITSCAELKAAGAEQAWLKMKEMDIPVSKISLMALEGAIRGVGKAHLPEKRKAELKEFFEENQ